MDTGESGTRLAYKTILLETFLANSTPGILDKERIIARPGFNRWLVPPVALAIHLCIGMAYGFSVFWLPLSKALGVRDGAHERGSRWRAPGCGRTGLVGSGVSADLGCLPHAAKRGEILQLR